MKTKILKSICAVASITLILSVALMFSMIYSENYDSMSLNVKNEARFIALGMPNGELDAAYLKKAGAVSAATRVTLISSDGTVIFDNRAKPEEMENHLSRPEVSAAIKTGYGEGARESETVGSQTFYYALKLKNGNILRVAETTSAVFDAAASAIPVALCIVIVVFIIAVMLAKTLTEKIVAPINTINLENPKKSDVYDELAPLVIRIEWQKQQIDSQIELLRKKQREFDAITENMGEGLLLVSSEHRILSINNSACELFGVAASQCIGMNLLTVSRADELRALAESALLGNSQRNTMQIGGRCYEIHANPVYDEQRLLGAVILALDITERAENEKRRREFSANVSHELKTPLTSISGYAELMQNGMAASGDIPNFANRIYREAQRMLGLINDIIELSRLDEQDMREQFEPCDLYNIACAGVDSLSEKAKEAGVKLHIDGESTIINAVSKLIGEMCYNLIDNAIKYNKADGNVWVEIGKRAERAVLIVRDDGIGIAAAHHARVFERFYRVDKSHSKETGGTGLGLSIVKHIASVHHADIEFSSKVDVGTTISILI